jgi:acyl-coenzyme A thioesterase PaaI-like protein
MQEAEDSPRHWCYGCGDRNPEGLHIVFEVEGRRVNGRFKPRDTHRGWPDVAHGGIAAAALDEAMGWATWAAGALSMTARMEVKYRRPLPLGEELIVSAEVTRDRGRRLEVEAEIRTLSGETLVQATGLFLRVPAERAREIEARFFGGDSARAGGLDGEEIPTRSSDARSS